MYRINILIPEYRLYRGQSQRRARVSRVRSQSPRSSLPLQTTALSLIASQGGFPIDMGAYTSPGGSEREPRFRMNSGPATLAPCGTTRRDIFLPPRRVGDVVVMHTEHVLRAAAPKRPRLRQSTHPGAASCVTPTASAARVPESLATNSMQCDAGLVRRLAHCDRRMHGDVVVDVAIGSGAAAPSRS